MDLNQRPLPAVQWFLGIPFTPLGLADAAARIAARPPGSPFVFVSTPNAQHAVHVDRGDPRFTLAHDRAWLVLNDSRILRSLSRRMFNEELPLAAGSDLTVELFSRHIRPADALTIIGGSDEVDRRLRARFGMQALARYNPPMGFYNDPAEIGRCVDFILAHPARYVFLAVGAPQSETVARAVLDRGGAVGVGLCVGSSLHFLTGVVRRAPAVFRTLHAEALYRLLQNPRRHARRVFLESLPVVWIALRTWIARRTRIAAGAMPHERRGLR
jgi:exopolysaccharide biosynthesis WecB/TagA/CpsF family protein